MTAAVTVPNGVERRRVSKKEMLGERPWVGGALGITALLLLWTVAGTVLPSRTIIPPPWGIVATLLDQPAMFLNALGGTFERASQGFALGNGAALACAAAILLVPRIESLVIQLGVVSHCIPITALAPLLIVILGAESTAVSLAALLVFFTTLVTVTAGLKEADPVTLDVVRAAGGGVLTEVRKVRLFAALPSLFGALQVAVPTALLGAVTGEFLGSISRGVGAFLIVSQRDPVPDRLWAMSVLVALSALIGYAVVGWIGRLAMPWTRRAA